jgi:DNA polymerase-3 subunit chi
VIQAPERTTAVTEIHFYHLQAASLERVLPALLEKCLERGWRAVVQAASDERVSALDDLLWTYADGSFLPHGSARDGDGMGQPVYLTTGPENPNRASVRFFVERTEVLPVLGRPDAGYERGLLVFDGNDEDALADARAQWTQLRSAGHTVVYWRQDENGRWEKKA